jgi:hypothetical protein
MEIPIDAIPSENKPIDPALANLGYDLPKLPATFMMLGRCGSGKSSILWALLTKGYMKGKKKDKSVFHEIIVYLGSQDSVDAFKKLPCKNLIVLQEFDAADFENYLNDLRIHQMERLSHGKHPLNIAVVFDDFVGQALLKHHGGKASPLERIALTSRHECNMSLFFCSQVYKGTGFSSCSMRNNTTTYVISNMSNPEMLKIAEEHCQNYTPDQFIQIYNEAMKIPYNFLTIDYRRPLDDRIRERFTGSLKSKSILKKNGKKESDGEGSGSDVE